MAEKGILSRREILRSLARAGALLPFVATGHPLLAHVTNAELDGAEASLSTRAWAPRFLTTAQSNLLNSMSEAIVPGSRQAEVNRFIDLLLSVDTKENQTAFLQALDSMNSTAIKQFGKSFLALTAEDQSSLLLTASERTPERAQEDGISQSIPEDLSISDLHDHFQNLKGWISGAYYSSELGMKELGWTPNRIFVQFPPCEHPDEHL